MSIPSSSLLVRPDLRQRVEHFGGRSLAEGVEHRRSRSYDHCFNYFATNPEPTADLEKSCAVLGFYLASWGMYRGSSYVFRETNSELYVPLISYIEEYGPALRGIDAGTYDDASKEQVIKTFREIRKLVLPDEQTAITLVTKIMVATFGCVPAYDTYFMAGMKTIFAGHPKASFWQMTSRSLDLIQELYLSNQEAIDDLASTSRTFRFGETTPTGLPLTRAKIIDMYGFDVGLNPSTADQV